MLRETETAGTVESGEEMACGNIDKSLKEGNEEEGAKQLVEASGFLPWQDWAEIITAIKNKQEMSPENRKTLFYCECDQVLEQVLQRHQGVSNHIDT